jgi:hypothetical protein
MSCASPAFLEYGIAKVQCGSDQLLGGCDNRPFEADDENVRGLGSADTRCEADLTSQTGADLSTSERSAGISWTQPRPQALAAGVAVARAEPSEAAAQPRGVVAAAGRPGVAAVVRPPEAAAVAAWALPSGARDEAAVGALAALPAVFEVSAPPGEPAWGAALLWAWAAVAAERPQASWQLQARPPVLRQLPGQARKHPASAGRRQVPAQPPHPAPASSDR